jgi:5S rRNA maturation endonuclease (ribonuclease M5)
LYGTSLSEQQKILIEISGAYNVILLLDPDKAGQDATREIKEKLSNCKLIIPEYNKDLKYMSGQEIRELCMTR